MKTHLLFSLGLLGAATSSLCAAPGDDAAIAAVLAADQARGAALLAADTKALDVLLAEDFNYTHSTNKQETKAAHIESYRQGMRYTRFETSALRAHVLTPGVVTLNGIIDQIKGKPGAMTEQRLLFLAVWRKTGGTWQLTTLQTAVPPAPAK